MQAGDLLLDFSKHRIDAEALTLLCQALESKGFYELPPSLLQGDKVNNTEQRAALHTALRAHLHLPRPCDYRGVIDDCITRGGLRLWWIEYAATTGVATRGKSPYVRL